MNFSFFFCVPRCFSFVFCRGFLYLCCFFFVFVICVGGKQQELVLKNVLLQMAKTRLRLDKNPLPFRILVIWHAESLTFQAQKNILQFIEEKIGVVRVILCTNNVYQIADALQSRCTVIRLSAPTRAEVRTVVYAHQSPEDKKKKIVKTDAFFHACDHGNLHYALQLYKKHDAADLALRWAPLPFQFCSQVVSQLKKRPGYEFVPMIVQLLQRDLLSKGYKVESILNQLIHVVFHDADLELQLKRNLFDIIFNVMHLPFANRSYNVSMSPLYCLVFALVAEAKKNK